MCTPLRRAPPCGGTPLLPRLQAKDQLTAMVDDVAAIKKAIEAGTTKK
jgi:hypothetical protein